MWDIVWNELQSKTPTLLQFYRHMFYGASNPLICFAISLVLKSSAACHFVSYVWKWMQQSGTLYHVQYNVIT